MIIYTMGFTQKSAKEFFCIIKKNEIDILVDVRLNNQSQLAGFTKGKDLEYFLAEIAHCKYDHQVIFAPTKELLNDYKKGIKSWDQYVEVYDKLADSRKMVDFFISKYSDYGKVMLLCSEPTPECCHRRLLAEKINKATGIKVIHV